VKLVIVNKENNSKLILDSNEEMIQKLISSNENLTVEQNENETIITAYSFNIQCMLFGHIFDINNVCMRCGYRR